ncbi:non-heme iron oxygenase ferredoxin subunit [Castellaniella sp. GW247-6E4]|uniref:Rieske (2Fe-2S) protein n=1 Tax=Castellaniella sp. GW247-6E4 TaxID=3140380 RepID=UPI0033154F7A
MSDEEGFMLVCDLDELSKEFPSSYNVNGKALAFFRTTEDVVALDEKCTHADASLAEGIFEGDIIECPLHGATFNIYSGEALTLPATVKVNRYATLLKEGKVYVNTDKILN